MTTIDTNVSNYTLSELLAILNMNEDESLSPQSIVEKTNKLIERFKESNPELSVFFLEMQSELLKYAQGLMVERKQDLSGKIVVEGFSSNISDAIYGPGEKQYTDWYENENLTQSDSNQANKITDRKQKIQLFGNEYVPMKQEQIATTDTYPLPVKQDSLNPNLKNTISRFVNLDSQFRQYTNGIDSTSTDYTLDLSDTLKNALSLRLYSYQIPFSWYAIDSAYQNTCFWVIDSSSNNSVTVSIPSGNYSQTGFQTQLGASIYEAGFLDGSTNIVQYNANSGIITLYFYGQVWTDPSDSTNTFTTSESTMILFYDFTGVYQCNNNCYNVSKHYFNNCLGWLMGYRVPYIYPVETVGNTAAAILDLNGPKYLILVIDDYNQNHVNNSLVSISQFNNTLKIPTYYSPDIPYTCMSPAQQPSILAKQGSSLNQLIAQVTIQSLTEFQSPPQNGLLIAGKYQQNYTSVPIVLPSAPRTITQAQLYTINQINNNGNNITNYLSKAPTSSDILGVIPVKTSTGVPTGSLLVEFSGSLQDNVRTYFGPVNIERMAVKLLDDKGNVLNLNGNDWCVTMVCECLYQY
jgi:hypothetical protein